MHCQVYTDPLRGLYILGPELFLIYVDENIQSEMCLFDDDIVL